MLWRVLSIVLVSVAGLVGIGVVSVYRELPHEHAVKSLPRTVGAKTESAVFAAGCFWGVEADFRATPGVVATTVGYTGGATGNPTYRDVSAGRTGHAEAVRVEFDPHVVSYSQLLGVFWAHQNPRQLAEPADPYAENRSAIFYSCDAQRQTALKSAELIRAELKLTLPVATTIDPVGVFYPAEDYQQQYLEKHGAPKCRLTRGAAFK